MTLNQEQQTVADSFFKFLLDENSSEMIISGPGGVGKTFLMGYLIDTTMPKYFDMCELMGIKSKYNEVMMTATTNKAAIELSKNTKKDTRTIQSFLGLKVIDDYRTGESKLTKSNSWKVHSNYILFIDECNFIDRSLLDHIRSGTHNCKIVYVGDNCQLGPIKEPISPVFKQNIPTYELTIPMRNSGQPDLIQLCAQFRDTVKTGNFYDIFVVDGVVDYFNDDDMEKYIQTEFKNLNHNQRILAYTNQRVVQYNDFVKEVRSQTAPYVVGETLVNNSAIIMKDMLLSVEAEVLITDINPKTFIEEPIEGMEIEMVSMTGYSELYGEFQFSAPVDINYFRNCIKYFHKIKNYNRYFYFKNTFPDLRAKDASTVHKAQGSTYDTVLIDLGNISSCHNPVLVARILYTAVSRARNRVIFYGKLAEKYGVIQK